MADTKKTDSKATPLTEEQLFEKEANLKTKSEKLDQDIAEFEAFQENIFVEKENLGKEKEAFEKEKEDFQAEKEAFEKEKVEFAKNSKQPKAKKEVPPVELKFEGVDYVFDTDAPKEIRIDGNVYTQKEIAADEDLKLQLIGGKSSLIIKK